MILRIFLLLGFLLAANIPAKASPVFISFSGEITYSEAEPLVDVGDIFSMTIIVDYDLPGIRDGQSVEDVPSEDSFYANLSIRPFWSNHLIEQDTMGADQDANYGGGIPFIHGNIWVGHSSGRQLFLNSFAGAVKNWEIGDTVSMSDWVDPDTSSLVRADLIVTAIVSEVPVPAAGWLFGSALIDMVGIKRKK